MKKILLIILSLISLSCLPWWTKSDVTKKYCRDAVTYNGKYKLLHYPLSAYDKNSIILSHKKNNADLIKLDRSSGKFLWSKKLTVKPVAIETHKQFVFVLTKNELYQHSSSNGKLLQKISFNNNYDIYSQAQDIAVKNETLYISLGTLGVNTYFFDEQNIIFMEKFLANLNQDNNHRSYITGVSLSPNNQSLLLAIDNITLGRDRLAFEGFLILDSEYLNITETLPLKNSRESFGRPLVHWNSEKSFLVDNMNVLMSFSTKLKPRKRTVSPIKRFLKYPNGGRPIGNVLVANKKIRYCELIGKAHKKHAIAASMTYGQ